MNLSLFRDVFMKHFLCVYRTFFLKRALFFTGLFFIGLFFSIWANANKDGKIHICFFELDNTTTSDNFDLAVKTNSSTVIHSYKIKKEELDNTTTSDNFDLTVKTNSATVIHPYKIEKKETGRQAFERMIQSGNKCDSLVLSGHHTGDWFGKTGTLWLKDMEALSCKQEYREWFRNIKTLWLDGCNTVTDDFIKSEQRIKTADSETLRVLGNNEKDKTKLDKDDMEIYQQSYAGSLDENTPLSSRYLRMFPQTQIYGFNGAAPEGGKKGQYSFIYKHLTELGIALKEEKNDKIASDFYRGLQVMFSDDPCDPETISAWEDIQYGDLNLKAVEHQDYKKAYQWGCDLILAKQVLDDPHSTKAQQALARQIINDPKYKAEPKKYKDILNLANKILTQPNSADAVALAKQSVLSTLKAIHSADRNVQEKDKTYTHLLFNNIYDTWNTAKKYRIKDRRFFNQVKSELKSPSFAHSFEERIKSPYTASLKKGDYIKFYTEIHDVSIGENDKKAQFLRAEIKKLLDKTKNVFSDLSSPRKRDLDPQTKRILAVSVVDQLLQYDLLSEGQIKELMSSRLFPTNTTNPFILDTWTKLKFTDRLSQIIPTVEEAKKHSSVRKRAIRIGAGILLDQVAKNHSGQSVNQEKNKLKQLAEKINVEESEDSYAFFQALFSQLRDKTDQEKENFIYDLSKNTGAQLEILVLLYAEANLSAQSRKRLYNRMTDQTHKRKFILKNGS